MFYLLFAAFIVVADQYLKYWTVQNVTVGAKYELIPGFLHLTYVKNTGAAFSMLEGSRWILVGVTAVCVIAILIFLFKSKIFPLGKIGAAAVLGGAIGNGIDRVMHGYVVDMLEAEFVRYAICNLADCFIVGGAILFFICYIVYSVRRDKKRKNKSNVRKERMQELTRLIGDTDKEESETKILEEFDLERRLSEEKGNDQDRKG